MTVSLPRAGNELVSKSPTVGDLMLLHSVTAYTDPLKSRSRCFESRVEMFTGSVLRKQGPSSSSGCNGFGNGAVHMTSLEPRFVDLHFFLDHDHMTQPRRQSQQQTVAPTRTRLTGVQTPGARGPDVAQSVRGGARRESSEHDQITRLRRLVKFV